jgi:PST family polysaccharide transporter
LRSQVRRGASWSALDVIVNRTSSFALGVVVARLLTPHAFGVYAVALVLHAIIINVSELGASAALVRDDEESVEAAAPTVVTIALVSSIVLGGLMAASAPLMAPLLGSAAASPVIQVMALSLPLAGMSAVPSALLRRHFRMDRLFVASVANSVSSGALVIVLALAGFGPLALAWSFVAGQLISTIVIIAFSPRRNRPGWDRGQARRLLGFGLPLAGANVLGFAIQNVDYIIVGRTLGAVALGLYVLAFNISGWPQNVISAVVRSVSLPAFSRLHQEGKDMPEQLSTALRIVSRLTFPVCLFLAALAHPLVVTVYGEKWAHASQALLWLAIFGALRTIIEVFSDFLVSLGRTKAIFVVQLVWLPALIGALLVFVPRYGILGAGVAHLTITGLVVIPSFVYFTSRAGVPVAAVVRSLVPTFCWAAATAVLVWVVASQIAAPVLACGAAGVLGLAVYLVPHLPKMLRMIAIRRRRSARSPAIEAVASP